MDNPSNVPFSPLEAISMGRFQGHTYVQEATKNLSTTRQTLIPNNPNRVFWMVINEGTQDVRLSTDPAITSTSGWLLPASGGIISSDWEEDGEAVGYQVFALSVVGVDMVRYREVIRI